MEIFGLNEELAEKEARNKHIYRSFLEGKISFRVLQSTCKYTRESLILLTKAKELFQTQLPKMPREYVLKQVFNTKHRTMCMFYANELIGAICFRPFFEQRFCEIVFFAIDFRSQIRGNGCFMMSLFKEYIKAEMSSYRESDGACEEITEIQSTSLLYEKQSFPVYFMTYADNSAIGFFKKQGFSRKVKFRGWVGYIKDYEGGTLMECLVYWEIGYLNAIEVLESVRNKVFKEISEEPAYGPICCTQEPEINEMVDLFKKDPDFRKDSKPREKILADFFSFLLSDLSSNASAWPFLHPVNAREVPDYYRVIKNPMDLSEMQKRALGGHYTCLKDFETDFFLIISNCYYYNGSTTQYYKCAQNLESYYQKRIQQYKSKPFLRHNVDKSSYHENTRVASSFT